MANYAYELIGVGSPVVDLLAQVQDSFLDQVEGDKGGMLLVDEAQIQTLEALLPTRHTVAAGGSAGNTAVATARLGLPTTFLGKIGNDELAAAFVTNFREAGGDTNRLKRGELPNARCISLVTPEGERTMRTYLGAAMTLDPSEVHVTDFNGCRHAHIEGYLLFNEALMRQVIAAAKDAGCTLGVDLASFEVVNAAKGILPELLRDGIDVIIANEEEARAYFGGDRSDYADMARELAQLGQVGIVKVGKDGAWLASGNEVAFAEPVKGVTAVDTTGAGDNWAAGFYAGWLRGSDLATAGRWGNLLGAQVVQELGAQIPAAAWPALQAKMGG